MSPWKPTVVGLVIGLIPAEANRICPGTLLEKLGEKHSLSMRVIDVDGDGETWSSWEPSRHHEGRGCLRVKPSQRTEN